MDIAGIRNPTDTSSINAEIAGRALRKPFQEGTPKGHNPGGCPDLAWPVSPLQ
jgi:hypothetical protein